MSDSGSYLRLETRGRKSGKPHSVIVRFVTYDGNIIIFPQVDSNQDWVRNVAATPKVRLYHRGRIIDGEAHVRGPLKVGDQLFGVFSRKYGDSIVRTRYWGQRMYVEIEPSAESVAVDYSELVYADLEAAFDGVAEDYDRHIYGNPINRWLRDRSILLLSRVFRPGATVLEVGCGTGTETLSLAKLGIKVLATDVSSKMLTVLKRHAMEEGVEELIIPIHTKPYLLKAKLGELGHAKVDGAYSTYGAINTEPRLLDLFLNLHSVLEPGGKLVLGVWNQFCLYETLGYGLRGKPSMAVARFRNPVPVGKSRFCVSSNAYSVDSLSRAIGDYFTLEKTYGVGIFLPPSNLVKYLPPEPLLSLVKSIEVRVESLYPWNRLGDHFLGVYTNNA